MKKFFQSKGFIVSSLALLCVTILGVCWFVSRDRTGDFRPDESPPSSVTGDWSDGGTQTDGDNGADKNISRLPNECALLDSLYGDETTTSDNIASMVKVSQSSKPVTLAVANLYLRQQIIFERV